MRSLNLLNIKEKVAVNSTEFESFTSGDLRTVIDRELGNIILDHKICTADENEIQDFFRSKGKLFEPSLFNNKKPNKNKQSVNMNSTEIKNMRVDMGLSQTKFAVVLGVDRRTIINYEQGKKIPESKVKLLNLMIENKNSKEKEIKSEEVNTVDVKGIKMENTEPQSFEAKYIIQLEAEVSRLKKELFISKMIK
ncbi:helix-turn-helix domain-containing protein [Flavobacterium sp. Arc3]|uniref:helix-turn-helix domain-containing protein n=1 Tax=Flavobacterium sp. Arc3 TaxID=3046686 RepID=UPI00352DF607